MDQETITQIIQTQLKGMIDTTKSYPQKLPLELAAWYVYVIDSGHCIYTVPKSLVDPHKDLSQLLVPIAVKTVLKGYAVQEDYIIAEQASYDQDLGVVTPENEVEF